MHHLLWVDNKKEESRKVLNSISARRNEITATYLWDGIRQLNLKELWEDLTTNNVATEANSLPTVGQQELTLP